MGVLDRLHVLSTPAAITVTSALFLSTYLLYQWLLPKPIPGIPYNEAATKSIFGDIPDMLRHLKTSKTVTDWLLANNVRHNTPIVQVFNNIFQKPWVLVSDYREAQDVLYRRTKEFDKPDSISDLLYGVSPAHHSVKLSNDEWRAQRKLMQDLMVPSFLHGVAAPQLHASFMDLIKLWTEKTRLAEGRLFAYKSDIYDTALEAMWAATLGLEGTATVTREQLNKITPLEAIQLPPSTDEEAVFEKAPAPPTFDTILKLTDTLESIIKSPFPRIQGLINRYLTPSIRRLLKTRDDIINAEITKAEKRMEAKGKTDNIKAAVDHMLHREKMAAAKQGRKPEYHSEVMIAELFGLLVAGHDTSSTTLLWGLKLLSAHPTVQTRLRTSLQTTFAEVHKSGSVPSAHDIIATQNHYLDAFIEEVLRWGHTASITSRTATQDAVVLGRVIPKGTRVVFMGLGHGILYPAFPIDDRLRSETYDARKTSDWNPKGINVFNPDRWLVSSSNGEKVFDSQAGPILTFGGGPRGCFGKRLAYIELRLAFTLIVWHFVLDGVPDVYGGWEAQEVLTHSPVNCFARLRKV